MSDFHRPVFQIKTLYSPLIPRFSCRSPTPRQSKLPSILISVPVMNFPAPLHNNTTAPVKSSGSPMPYTDRGVSMATSYLESNNENKHKHDHKCKVKNESCTPQSLHAIHPSPPTPHFALKNTYHRTLLQPQLPQLHLTRPPTQSRIHNTRTNTINPDTMPNPLARHRTRQVVDASFGDGVGGMGLGLIDDVAGH